jgi:RNA-directed DNA polymerase
LQPDIIWSAVVLDDLVDVCALALGTTRESTMSIARIAPYRMRRLELTKRDGSKRIIWQAAIETKGIQYPLIYNYLQHLPIHSASQAFSPGSSIKKNATHHLGHRYFLRMDFSNFFPSIKFDSFKKVITANKDKFAAVNTSSPDSLFLIKNICFSRNEALPIGYATSPYVANCAMFDFDSKLSELLGSKISATDVTYTRYADDLIFSTNEKGTCRDIYALTADFIKKYKPLSLTLNHQKTHFGSTAKGTAYVTGVHILDSKRTAATKSLRSEARFLLSLTKVKNLEEDEQRKLVGLLAHIRQIDPSYYTKLASDFFQTFPFPSRHPQKPTI